MPVVAFEVIEKVLGRIEGRARDVHGAELDERVSSTLVDLGSKYSRLSSSRKPIIDYSDPATHVAYLYGYVPAHAAFVRGILYDGRAAEGRSLFNREAIKVTSLGGGPGSDLLGLLKYLTTPGVREPVKQIRIRILDCEDSWARVCGELAELASSGIELELEFVRLDVTDPKAREGIDWSDEDLLAMSFFVSEVCCLDARVEVGKFFDSAFQSLKAGALVLYNDNRDSTFRDFFDARLEATGNFEAVVLDDAADMRLTSDEQASV